MLPSKLCNSQVWIYVCRKDNCSVCQWARYFRVQLDLTRSISAIHDRLSVAKRRQCGRSSRATRWCRTERWVETITALRNRVFEWVNKCCAGHIKTEYLILISAELLRLYRVQQECSDCYREQLKLKSCEQIQRESDENRKSVLSKTVGDSTVLSKSVREFRCIASSGSARLRTICWL